MVDLDTRSIAKLALVVLGTVGALVAGVILFGVIPWLTPAGALEVVLALLTSLAGLYVAGKVIDAVFTEYNTAKVTIEGAIQKSTSGGVPIGPDGAGADDIVEQIEKADEDGDAEALVLELDTPGGKPVASDDIREAAADFDGPTFAYAKDLCASGGMVVACGCDEFFARDDSLVGSIGVIANQRKFADLAEEYGVTLERFTGGEYKDTFDPLKDLSEDERDYFQGVIDASYDGFVELVADSRGLDVETVRDTEARVFHASQAYEADLVDHVGTHSEFETLVADRIGVDEVEMEEFEPDRGITDKVGIGAQRVAYALGAGVASVLADDGGPTIEFKY